MAEKKSGGCLTGLGCLFLIWSIVWIIHSSSGIWETLSNRELTKLTYAEYVDKKPDAAWIEITDAKMMAHQVIYRGFLGAVVEELYIPVRGPDSKKSEKISVLLHTEDKELVARISKLKADLDGAKTKGEKLLILLKSGVKIETQVVGMVVHKDDLDEKVRDTLDSEERNLAEDYVVIEHHRKPAGLGIGVVLLLVGVAGLLGSGAFVFYRLKQEADDDEDTDSAVPVATSVDDSAGAQVPVAKPVDDDEIAEE